MQSKPGKLGDFPDSRPMVTFQGGDVLDDDAALEEEEEEEDEDGAMDATPGLDPVGKTFVQLTVDSHCEKFELQTEEGQP